MKNTIAIAWHSEERAADLISVKEFRENGVLGYNNVEYPHYKIACEDYINKNKDKVEKLLKHYL